MQYVEGENLPSLGGVASASRDRGNDTGAGGDRVGGRSAGVRSWASGVGAGRASGRGGLSSGTRGVGTSGRGGLASRNRGGTSGVGNCDGDGC